MYYSLAEVAMIVCVCVSVLVRPEIHFVGITSVDDDLEGFGW